MQVTRLVVILSLLHYFIMRYSLQRTQMQSLNGKRPNSQRTQQETSPTQHDEVIKYICECKLFYVIYQQCTLSIIQSNFTYCSPRFLLLCVNKHQSYVTVSVQSQCLFFYIGNCKTDILENQEKIIIRQEVAIIKYTAEIICLRSVTFICVSTELENVVTGSQFVCAHKVSASCQSTLLCCCQPLSAVS